MKFFSVIFIFVVCFACSEVSKEKRPMVEALENKIRNIDSNHRVRIEEDDFHQGDSIFKIRGYFMGEDLIKLVGILHTPTLDRDDYFYFENHEPLFSGHILIDKGTQTAEEYKYYYGDDGYVAEALYWKDHYKAGAKFPHEKFKEFSPEKDSLRNSEERRLYFLLVRLEMEGIVIKHLNENLEANKTSI